MKPEIIERMLIDRALGALEPDTDALLDAYLEKEPALKNLAAGIDETVLLTKQAMPIPKLAGLPPLKARPFPSPESRFRFPSALLWPAGIAAAFFLGLSLSVLIPRQNTTLISDMRPATETRPAIAVTPSNNAAAPQGFWSIKRLASLTPNSSAPAQPRVRNPP